MLKRLNISWSTSRGRDTYGYNICRLDDSRTRKRYRCMGGGYDMIGTVFGEWLTDMHAPQLAALFASREHVDAGYAVKGYRKIPDLYEVTMSPDGKVHCDGACGIESMIRIAEAIGLQVQQTYSRKGRTTGFIVLSAED